MSSELVLPPDERRMGAPRALAERLGRTWWPWLALEVPLLAAVGWRNADNVFYDTMAYLRVAEYYQTGRLDLAVNGYWGPLISWLMAPLLAITGNQMLTVRIAMGLSALLFFWAGVRLVRRLGLSPLATTSCTALLVVFSACWSVEIATPDLLMSGFLLAGLGDMLSAGADPRRRSFIAGVWWGLAYLAKSVALPTSLGLMLVLGLLRWMAGTAPAHAIARSVAVGVLSFALVAGPWIAMLSLHYGTPTFSTSAAINFALVGPRNPDRHHAMLHAYRVPEPGRLSSWEDPSLTAYQRWSPFDDRASFAYAVRLIARNGAEMIRQIAEFDWLRIGLLGALLGLALQMSWARDIREQPWRLAAPVIGVIAAPYLPLWPDETRYYLACYPFLVAAGFGFTLDHVVRSSAVGDRWPRITICLLVGASFLVGLRYQARDALEGTTDPAYRTARALLPVLTARHGSGTLLSVDDGGVGYYAAYLTGKPFYGDNLYERDPQALRGIGAEFLITRRTTPLAHALDTEPPGGFDRLDTDDRLPVLVYRIHPGGSTAPASRR